MKPSKDLTKGRRAATELGDAVAQLEEAAKPFLTNSPTQPAITLLCKLGSIAVHAEEAFSNDAHEVDIAAIKGLLADAEVKEWIAAMGAFLPLKRKK